jgi:hypothetical protein
MAKRSPNLKIFDQPLVTVPAYKEAGIYPDLSLWGHYQACHSGEIDCLRRGKKIFVKTASEKRKLGLA